MNQQQQNQRSEDGEGVQRKDDDFLTFFLLQNQQGGGISDDCLNLLLLLGDNKDDDFLTYFILMNQQQQNQRSEDGEGVQRKDDDFLTFFLLQNQQGGGISDDCLNLLLLLGDDKEDDRILMFYLLQQQQQNQQQQRSEGGDVQRGKGMEMFLMMLMMNQMNDNKNNYGGFNNIDMSSVLEYYMQSGEVPPEVWMFMMLSQNANQQGRDERKEDNKLLLYFLLNQNQNATESCDQALLWLLALDDKQEDDFFIYYLLQQQRGDFDLSQLDSVDLQAARGKDDESDMIWMMLLSQMMKEGDFNLDYLQQFMSASKKGIDATSMRGHSTGTIVGAVLAVVVLVAFGTIVAAMVVYIRRARKRREYQNVPLIQNESDERRGLMTWSSKNKSSKENLVI